MIHSLIVGLKPTPSEYGDHCPLCFSAGKTPETFQLFIGGINLGALYSPGDPMPPNGRVNLDTQLGTCEWKGSNSTIYQAILGWYVTHSALTVEAAFEFFSFVHSPSEQCTRYFINQLLNPAVYVHWGGFAVLITQTEILEAVKTIMPVDESDARFEVFPKADGLIDIRYASLKQRTNILCQFRVDELWP